MIPTTLWVQASWVARVNGGVDTGAVIAQGIMADGSHKRVPAFTQ